MSADLQRCTHLCASGDLGRLMDVTALPGWNNTGSIECQFQYGVLRMDGVDAVSLQRKLLLALATRPLSEYNISGACVDVEDAS